MDLLKNIKQQRAEQRKKQPVEKGVFNPVSAIIKQYGLEQNFLDALDNVNAYLPGESLASDRVKVKKPLDIPLFSLATEDEYALAMSIIRRIDNPYLEFAATPEEIILSKPLYRLNPALHPEKLVRYHFETLILHERSKTDHMKTLHGRYKNE
jgi:hypothetical protein